MPTLGHSDLEIYAMEIDIIQPWLVNSEKSVVKTVCSVYVARRRHYPAMPILTTQQRQLCSLVLLSLSSWFEQGGQNCCDFEFQAGWIQPTAIECQFAFYFGAFPQSVSLDGTFKLTSALDGLALMLEWWF